MLLNDLKISEKSARKERDALAKKKDVLENKVDSISALSLAQTDDLKKQIETLKY